MEKRRNVDVAEVTRLYVGERLTLAEIAARLGAGASTITRRLAALGIARRPRGPNPAKPRGNWTPVWNAGLAYAVGIITTDGNLGRRRPSIRISSKDFDLLDTVKHGLQLSAPIASYRGGNGRSYLHLQWRNRAFHSWLLGIGLMPAKSLRLGSLAIPDEWFTDFVRGCIDGDGSIVTYTDRYHVPKNQRYVYERLWISLVSASRPFIEWIRETLMRLRGIRGSLTVRRRAGRSPIWTLRYGKRDSLSLIAWMYYSADVPCLARKRDRALAFVACEQKRRRLNAAKPVQ